LLIDLLKHLEVTDLLFHADAEIETKEVKEEVKEEVQSELKKQYFFCDMYTYSSPNINGEFPLFRYKVPGGGVKEVSSISGNVVDIQFYEANYKGGEETFPKVRFVIQSSAELNKYLVFQMRYDKFYDAIMANCIAEWILNDGGELNISFSKGINPSNGKEKIDFILSGEGNTINSGASSGFIAQPTIAELENKFHGAIKHLADIQFLYRVLLPNTDKGFVKNREK
jgi:hypothetical protein